MKTLVLLATCVGLCFTSPLTIDGSKEAKAAPITGNATCDNVMQFYADGALQATSSRWTVSTPISIPADTLIVGIECRDLGVVGGIKAALSNGIQTDVNWRCSNTLEEGWNLPGFDDSNWENAFTPGFNWGSRPQELDGRAEWIWTPGYKGEDTTVYCRRNIQPRVNGGWSSWTRSYGRCSASCGIGFQQVVASRTCDNPPPSNGGLPCVGPRVIRYIRPCRGNRCPVDGGWSDWSDWEDTSDCDALCAGGEKTQYRDRTCTNPPPIFGGKDCEGDASETRTAECNTFSCDELCVGETHYLSHRNPRRFWQCSNGVAIEMNCAPGTVWNPEITVCDHPSAVNALLAEE